MKTSTNNGSRRVRARALLASFALLAALGLGGCAQQEAQPPSQDDGQAPAYQDAQAALIPNQLDRTQVARNPYLPDSESSVHNDAYNSDVTAAVLPLGIFPEVSEATAEGSAFAPPTLFYDALGNAIMPYNEVLADGTVLSGGIAIRDADSPTLDVLGSYLPALDDAENGRWGMQISYAFVDVRNYLVGPASNGHVVMIRTTDETGNVLPKFEKALDVDIVGGAVAALGQDVSQSLLSVAYDYEGNLWFVSGGFHMNPAHSKAGYCGYLERAYIDAVLSGTTDLKASDYLRNRFAYTTGEGAAPLDITSMTRRSVTAEEFQVASGADARPASYLLTACAPASDDDAALALRVNGLAGKPGDYEAWYLGEDGLLSACAEATLVGEDGAELTPEAALDPAAVYEVRLPLQDAAAYDLDPAEGSVKASLILATRD